MKKILAVFLSLVLSALCLGTAFSEGETPAQTVRPGEKYADFTVTDTLGNAFTLSEALKTHDAVLINFFATWCPPCRAEFPFLNEAFEKYGDRVAFLSLSSSQEDTMEAIEAFRAEYGVSFPMGMDEGARLDAYTNVPGYPATFVIDRFGNLAFCHSGPFYNTAEVARVLEHFLGEDYTETSVLDGVPMDTSTAAYPVSASRRVTVENASARTIKFRASSLRMPVMGYVVTEDTARLLFEVSAADNISGMMFTDGETLHTVRDMPVERGRFVFSQPMPGRDLGFITCGLSNMLLEQDNKDAVIFFLLVSEENIEDAAEFLRTRGYQDVSWQFLDAAPAEDAAAVRYIVHILDQYGAPVAGAAVIFCTDSTCTPCVSDSSGIAAFDGAPENYHVQLMKVPEGYSFDEGFDMYTGDAYGEWVVRIRKN
ncbi:MAG: redoxin domain-containing protein [Clostridia bacterium]|nr:redoxin domain-containing protein [Clostridia bacterium]